MTPIVMAEGGLSLATALTSFSSVMTEVWTVISSNEGLFVMFAGGCLAVGAKVFKKIKNAVK